jgi:protein phosphatase
MSMLIHQTSLTHEDHTRLFGGSQGQLLLVADGMGGHAEGKRASSIAVQTISHYVLNTMHWFLRLHENREEDLEEELKKALELCQRTIAFASEGTAKGSRRMGTTLTMAYVHWPRLYVVHAGDSRCYLYRNRRLEQITKDHTVAQQLVDRGALSAAEAEESRWSRVLWNCVGGDSPDLEVDAYKARLQIGDILLLATDGLTKAVKDQEIVGVLNKNRDAKETCGHLVNAANEQGGKDNVTVVVAHFRDTEDQVMQRKEVAAKEQQIDLTEPDMENKEAATTFVVPA